MNDEIDAEFYRVTFEIGGQKSTRWADALTVDPEGFVAFRDVETGHKRFVSASTEYIVTGIGELPPAVRDTAETADADGEKIEL